MKNHREITINILSDHLGVAPSGISDESNLVSDLGMNSLDVVEIIMAFEEEYGVEIYDLDDEKIKTVGDVLRYIERYYDDHVSNDSAFNGLRNILVSHLEIAPEQVTLGAHVFDDLGADSLDAIEITMAIEEHFGISIDDEDEENLKTVAQIVEYIKVKNTLSAFEAEKAPEEVVFRQEESVCQIEQHAEKLASVLEKILNNIDAGHPKTIINSYARNLLNKWSEFKKQNEQTNSN